MRNGKRGGQCRCQPLSEGTMIVTFLLSVWLRLPSPFLVLLDLATILLPSSVHRPNIYNAEILLDRFIYPRSMKTGYILIYKQFHHSLTRYFLYLSGYQYIIVSGVKERKKRCLNLMLDLFLQIILRLFGPSDWGPVS